MNADHKLYDKGKKVEVLEDLGSVTLKDSGRTYKLARERVLTGEEYISIKLYNGQGKFIKRLMIDEEALPGISVLLLPFTVSRVCQLVASIKSSTADPVEVLSP